MILDILISGLCAACFVGGWWCRGKFGTADAMVDAGATKVKGWLGRAP